MTNIKDLYTSEHKKKIGEHLYPTEWIVRTMLGNYPNLAFDKSCYSGGKILDVGFGDGRNFQLFKNIGLEIHGIEITKEIIELVRENIAKSNIDVNLVEGNNANIPFEDNYFDIVLGSSSLYYVDKGTTFMDNLMECSRVLKSNGILIANFPEMSKNFICKNAMNIGDNHIIIQNDVHNLRNGFIFKAFNTKNEIEDVLSDAYKDICIGYLNDIYFGYELSSFIVVATKK
jgi:ubiquinone/menaquinone biosynthesis C-methylase UbiE